jgi:hypothetical protein
MTNDITTIVFAKTFHVLGIITRSAGPRTTEAPQDLAGKDGLVLRVPSRPDLQIVVDISQLALENVAANEDVMMRPLHFVLTGDPNKPPMVPGEGTKNDAAPPVALDGTTATVKVPTAPTTDLDFYIQVGKTPIKMTIRAGLKMASHALQASSGDNAFLLLVPGYEALLDVVHVP